MATHPYIGGSGAIIQAVNHLRRSFPSNVTADTLKKLGIAAKNESYLINILRFLSIIDEEGKRTEKAAKVFNLHDAAEFQKAFGEMVKSAYVDLFALHGEAAWALDVNVLITFFRQADQSSGIVGGRQASTFRTLAALAGHGEAATPRPRTSGTSSKGEDKSAKKSAKKVQTPRAMELRGDDGADSGSSRLGLTVRIEINLPADATQETYDKIFQSLRKNLIDG
jgi:hypothetical protein